LLRFALKTLKNRLPGDFLPCELLSGFSRKGRRIIVVFAVRSGAKTCKRNRLLGGRVEPKVRISRRKKGIYYQKLRVPPGNSVVKFLR
jgi:hypothetical protein